MSVVEYAGEGRCWSPATARVSAGALTWTEADEIVDALRSFVGRAVGYWNEQ